MRRFPRFLHRWLRAKGALLAWTLGVGILSWVSGTPPAAAQPSFEGVGSLSATSPYSEAYGAVSLGGATLRVVGRSSTPATAFVWDDGVMAAIPFPAGTNSSFAFAVSDDGSAVTGIRNGTSGSFAFHWTDLGGSVDLVPIHAGVSAFAKDISADGSVIVGKNGDDAFRWEGGVMAPLGLLPGGSWSQATGVSADGDTVAGYGDSFLAPAEEFEAWIWRNGEGLTGLGDLPGGDGASRANDVSADGEVVVGGTSSAGGIVEAFRWTEADGMESICDIAFCDSVWSEALAVSGDGTVILGVWNSDYFIWIEGVGMQMLEDYFAAEGVSIPSGWSSLETVQTLDISNDGNVIVGTGRNPDGDVEGWVVNLPEPAPGSSLLCASGLLLWLARRRILT